MSSIRFCLNGRELATAGGAMLSSIDWDLTASRYEDAGALLRVSALRNRSYGHYDCRYFLEDLVVADSSELEIRWAPGGTASPIAHVETHEQAEALRSAISEKGAPAGVEAKGAHAMPPLRARSALEVNIEGLPTLFSVAEGPVELVVLPRLLGA